MMEEGQEIGFVVRGRNICEFETHPAMHNEQVEGDKTRNVEGDSYMVKRHEDLDENLVGFRRC